MPLNISKCTLDIYADDTAISSSASWKEIPKLQQAILEGLQEVEKWSRTTNMYLNPSKTKAMMAVGKRLRKRFERETFSLKLSRNDKEIEIVRSHKLRGSGGSSVSQNKLPQLILGYIYILKYLQSNFIG